MSASASTVRAQLLRRTDNTDLNSPGQPQRPRCLPHHYRRVPTRSYHTDRRPCEPSSILPSPPAPPYPTSLLRLGIPTIHTHILLSIIQSRLAVNSVTLGDFSRPMRISRFVKEVHAGFQLLNLKNDSLRKRSDGIKYNVSERERVQK